MEGQSGLALDLIPEFKKCNGDLRERTHRCWQPYGKGDTREVVNLIRCGIISHTEPESTTLLQIHPGKSEEGFPKRNFADK